LPGVGRETRSSPDPTEDAGMTEETVAAARTEVRRQLHEYAQGEERPIGGYLTVLSAFGASVAGLTLARRLTGRRAAVRLRGTDLLLLTAATHKLSRLVAKDPVSSPLRMPFTLYEGVSAPSELAEEVRGHGLRHAVGELLTCPFCLAPWVVTALLGTWNLSPATGRTVCTALTAIAGSDFLQYAYVAAQQAEQD
jgi:hypothetical protein